VNRSRLKVQIIPPQPEHFAKAYPGERQRQEHRHEGWGHSLRGVEERGELIGVERLDFF